MTNNGPFFGMDNHKSNISLISGAISVRRLLRPADVTFLKLVDETQMFKPLEQAP